PAMLRDRLDEGGCNRKLMARGEGRAALRSGAKMGAIDVSVPVGVLYASQICGFLGPGLALGILVLLCIRDHRTSRDGIRRRAVRLRPGAFGFCRPAPDHSTDRRRSAAVAR